MPCLLRYQAQAARALGDGSGAFRPGILERKSSAETSQYGARYDGFGATYATSGTSWGPFGFAGQWGSQTHADSGLMLLGHRYYDSSTGRFLSCDPIKDGRNWYAYCGNNPLNGVDPWGLVKITLHWRSVVGGAQHAYLIVEDNVKGSPTYGQRYIISGGPETRNTNNYGMLLNKSGVAAVGQMDFVYGRGNGEITLVDDQSDYAQWLKEILGWAKWYHSREGYNPLTSNSNAFISNILDRLGLGKIVEHYQRFPGLRGRQWPLLPGWGHQLPLPVCDK